VDKGSSTAKFWLINISLSKNNGFSPAEFREIPDLILKHDLIKPA